LDKSTNGQVEIIPLAGLNWQKCTNSWCLKTT